MGKFADQFGKALDNAHKKVELSATNGVILLFAAIVKDTPVDTGNLRGNWQATIDNPASDLIPRVSKDGTSVINEIQQTVTAGKINWLLNYQPYAPVVEYGLYPNPPKNPTGKTENGFSAQAPQGMVTINTSKFKSFLKVGAEQANGSI